MVSRGLRTAAVLLVLLLPGLPRLAVPVQAASLTIGLSPSNWFSPSARRAVRSRRP
ncbi:MAG TPA: hypothetical protein VFN57_01555 [Thermomicrobiaceae bacterium]|nr:hypothetical protein [Thermomicrobiaceae bacterium]